jgi:effector-binding domain-containing protein
MRILKYLFLLFLLAFVALAVFVATQKGDYDIVRSIIIKSPKTVVFNYVNDFRNWENWVSWKENDSNVIYNYPENTIGIGSSYSWSGADDSGNIKTIFVKTNDSLVQTMNYNESLSKVFWSFKDTLDGTKVIWRTKGTLPFMDKIYAVVKGGPEKVIGIRYERSLLNLDKILDYEIKTYSIEVNGLVTKTSTYYLQKNIISKISNLSKNLKIMLPNLLDFCKKNNIAKNGNPFVIYHSYDENKGITNFSACIPVREEIFTSIGSDLTGGKLESFQAVKTTLTGDYSHSRKAWNETTAYITKNKLTRSAAGPAMEIYTKGITQEKSPSKWVTHLYIAINPKNAPPKVFMPIVLDSTVVSKPTKKE